MSGSAVMPRLDGTLMRQADWRWTAAMCCFLAALAAAVWWIGHAPQSSYPWSSAILLDGGSRVALGQVPHRDFHTPVGFGYLGFIAMPMRWWSAGIDAIAQAVALSAPLVGLAAWWISSRRLPAILAAAATAWISLMWCSVGTLGSQGLADITYGGHYSRLCWALTAIIAIAVCAPPRDQRSTGEWLLLGALAGALCATKITFAAAAGVACAAALVVHPGRSRILAVGMLAVGWSAIHLLAWLATGASMLGYLADLAVVGRANATGPLAFMLGEAMSLDALAAASSIGLVLLLAPGLAGAGALRRWSALAAIGGFGLLLSATSGCETMSPVLTIVPLAACIMGLAATAAPRTAWSTPALALLSLLLIAEGVRLARPLVSLGRERISPPSYAQGSDLDGPYAGRRYLINGGRPPADGQPLTSLTRHPAAVTCESYTQYVESGCAAIRAAGMPAPRVVSLDFANPFPFTMQLPPPQGDIIYWHVDRNVATGAHPTPDELFADADLVIEPLRPIVAESLAFKQTIYGPWLQRHAVVAWSSPWWKVWKVHR